MGNLGAYITLNGKDMKPNFTTYDAVVSIKKKQTKTFFLVKFQKFILFHFLGSSKY